MYRENTSPLSVYARELGHLPELEGTVKVFAEPSGTQAGAETDQYVAETYLGYLQLVRALAHLSPADIERIRRANELRVERSIGSGSNVDHGADYFVEVLGSHRESLPRIARHIRRPSSPLFQEGLRDLRERMELAQGIELKALRDGTGSDRTDRAIWGYRHGLTPRADVHFVTYHMTERAMRAGLNREDIGPDLADFISHKDFLALGDILALQRAQGKANQDIARVWSSSRDQGGVQWLSDEKQEVFDEVVADTRG